MPFRYVLPGNPIPVILSFVDISDLRSDLYSLTSHANKMLGVVQCQWPLGTVGQWVDISGPATKRLKRGRFNSRRVVFLTSAWPATRFRIGLL